MANLLNIEEYIVNRLRTFAPSLDFGKGSAIRDLLVSPLVLILQPLANEIERVKRSQSLSDISSLSDEDVDALVANVFISRRIGGTSVGTARVYLDSQVSLTISPGSIFLSRDGKRFFSTRRVVVEPQTVLIDSETGAYYVDVAVQAEKPGDEYNIEANQLITMVSNSTAIVGVTNIAAFVSGAPRESSQELVERAKVAISTRDLVTGNSIRTVLADNYPLIKDISVVGFHDPEMVRDILKGKGLSLGSIRWPDPARVHIGGKLDIYLRAALTTDRIEIQNPDEHNDISLYEYDPVLDANETDVLFECPTCFTINSPIVSVDLVTEVDSQGRTIRELTENEDFIVYPTVPGEALSSRDRTKIKFVEGTGVMEDVKLIGVSAFSPNIGYIIRFNDSTNSPAGGLLVKNAMLQSSFGDVLIDGTVDSDTLGYSIISGDQAKFGGSSLFMNGVAVSDDSDQPLPYVVRSERSGQISSTSGFTFFGWAYAKSFGQITGNVSPSGRAGTIMSYGDSISLYVSDDGRLNFQLWTENVRNPTVLSSVNPFVRSGDLNKWFFWAITYDSQNRRRILAQYADGSYGIKNAINVLADDVDTSRQFGPLHVSGSPFVHFGSDKDYVRTWDGYIDEVVYTAEVMDTADLSSIYARSSIAQISGLEKSQFGFDSTAGATTTIDKDSLVGRQILVYTGEARGGVFQIIANDDYSDPNISSIMLIQEAKQGNGRLSDIKSGDCYAFLPNGTIDTEFASIGKNIVLDYSYSTDITAIQEFFERESNRVVVSDPLVKSFSPIYVSFSMTYAKKAGSTLTSTQLRDELVKAIQGVPLGGTLDVSDLVNVAYSIGANYIQLPIVVNIDYRTSEGRFVRAAIRDRFNSDRTQGFVVLSSDKIQLTEVKNPV